MKYTILIIEDNRDVNLMLAEALTDAGYQTKSAYTGIDGFDKIRNDDIDLVLLDIMIPYKSGDQVLKEMRMFSDIPVIVISAKDMIGTKIDLLKLGADDYITKPFDLGEVIALVESNLRRSRQYCKKNNTFQYKDMVLDGDTKCVTLNGKELELTAREYKILELLVQNKGKVFTRANLYETVWGSEYLGDDNAVKTHISNLRNKLKKLSPDQEYIETVWGLGYRLYQS
jgi:DNA-binding response OmpR family regulator